MYELLVVAMELVTVRTLDNREVFVNPEQIVALSEPKQGPDSLGTTNASWHCVVTLADGKFLSVKDSCTYIREMMKR